MWQLSESHLRAHAYQLTDAWQGVVTVCSWQSSYRICFFPSVSVLSLLEKAKLEQI